MNRKARKAPTRRSIFFMGVFSMNLWLQNANWPKNAGSVFQYSLIYYKASIAYTIGLIQAQLEKN
jgi:hypothetical protein